MRMNCGRWKNIQERCQGISDVRSRMTAAIRQWRRSQRYVQKEVRAMKIYAVKNDKDSYPNIGDMQKGYSIGAELWCKKCDFHMRGETVFEVDEFMNVKIVSGGVQHMIENWNRRANDETD